MLGLGLAWCESQVGTSGRLADKPGGVGSSGWDKLAVNGM